MNRPEPPRERKETAQEGPEAFKRGNSRQCSRIARKPRVRQGADGKIAIPAHLISSLESSIVISRIFLRHVCLRTSAYLFARECFFDSKKYPQTTIYCIFCLFFDIFIQPIVSRHICLPTSAYLFA